MVAADADSLTGVLISAGEASGDRHAAGLMEAADRRAGQGRRIRFFGLGGDAMAAAGLEPVAHSDEVAVVGIAEVVRELPRIRRVFRKLLRAADTRRPSLAVLVDFPDFNLRLARRLRRRGIPVLYYVSPQVWAWRRRRVRTIARLVDRMLVLFPFEFDVYRGHELHVDHVGHPLVDDVPELESAWDRQDGVPAQPVLALLPGSRNSEVRRILPPMLRAAAALVGTAGRAGQVRLILAPTVDQELVRSLIAGGPLDAEEVEVVACRPVRRGRGVATSRSAPRARRRLEVGLLGTPMVVVYRVSPLTYAIGRLLVDLPFVSLVNLVLGRQVVPELLQAEADHERIAAAASGLLTRRSRVDVMRKALAELRPALGESGASERAAACLLEELDLLDEPAGRRRGEGATRR